MPFCTHCGSQIESQHRYCANCGRPVAPAEPGSPGTTPATVSIPDMPYLITPTRVLVMTVLSYGLYLFYWFYLTWKQYRDHTKDEAFPVWHVLTLCVPIYGLFRVHAHVRAFVELMVKANVFGALSPGAAVALVMVASWLGWGSAFLAGGFTGPGEITRPTAIAIAAIDALGMAVVAGLLLNVQSNLNRYWASLPNVKLVSARIGVGEVVFGLIGMLAWFDTLANLLSPAYRQLQAV